MRNALRIAACAAALLAACGPDAPAPGRPAAPAPSEPGSAASSAAPLAVSGPGAPAHDLYAARAIACDACHPCGKRMPGGHEQPWMDAASAGFHAFSANSGLQGCTICHGPSLDGVGGSVSISCAQCHGASWRTDCTMCHGGPDGAAPPSATWGREGDSVRVGAHAAHLRSTHALSNPVPCATCHVVPADALDPGHADGPTATVAFTGLAVQVGFPAAWDRGTATCTSTYCHAGRAGGQVPAPVWTRADGADRACGACHGSPPPAPHPENPACGSCHTGYSGTAVVAATHVDGKVDLDPNAPGVTCSTCHGGPLNPAPPRGTRGELETTARGVGAHQAHLGAHALSGPIACNTCHAVPLAMNHADGSAQVLPSIGWSRTSGTCTNACHGQFTPVWTRVDGTQAACGTCHAVPPPAPHSQNPDCDACHEGYTPASVNLALHLNGTVDRRPLTCSSCHGSAVNAAPPIGLLGETSTATRAVGAHQAHLSGGALAGPVACDECHAVVPSAMDHTDGIVQLGFGPRAHANGAAPAWFADTLTCDGTYCHGATLRSAATGDPRLNLSPRWTGGAGEVACGSCHLTPPPAPHPRTQLCGGCHPGYSLTGVNLATHVDGITQAENISCSSCHGDETRVLASYADPLAIAAPPYGTRGETSPTTRSVGAHQAHVNRVGGLSLPNDCVACHVVPAPDAWGHADGASQVTFGDLAVVDGAQPLWNGQTCSNTYCHGSTLHRGGTSQTPTWTTPGPLACGTCHGAPPPSPHPQDSDCIRCHPGYTSTTVRRATHVNGISDFPSGCNSCHDDPPATGRHYKHMRRGIGCDGCHAGYTAVSENPALHRNAVQDVTVPWDKPTRTCGANACHGSHKWGPDRATTSSCNQCHGSPPASGQHYEHYEYGCDVCHGAGYTKTRANVQTHMDGDVDVPLSFYSFQTLTCSANACHGSHPWGDRQPVTPNCSNCHGYPPDLPHPQSTSCWTCHPSMTSSGTVTASHNDGILDLSGSGCTSCHGYPPTTTRTGAIHTTDTNCYGCHSTSVGPDGLVLPNGTHNDGAVQVGGGGVGTYGCQSCHGDQARTIVTGADPHVKSSPPLGTRGEALTSQRAVGAHQAHLNKATGAISKPVTCGECHPVPSSMDHANGSTLMAFGPLARTGGAAPSFDGSALTCASTYCHGATLAAGGTNHTPTWTGGPSDAACGTCHGGPPPAPHPSSTACGGCHQGYTASSVNPATHVDGIVQQTMSCTSCHGAPPPPPHSSSAACGGCHAGYTATTVNPALHMNGTVESTPLGCTSCHGKAGQTATAAAPLNAAPPVDTLGAASGLRVGAHQKHLTGGAYANALSCQTCHASVGSYTVSHPNGTNQVGFTGAANANLRKGSWTPRSGATAGSCSASWCHGAVMSSTGGPIGGTLTAPPWSGATIGACDACHTIVPDLMAGRHRRHASRFACSECHPGYTTTAVNKAAHVNGVKEVSSSHISSWNGTSCTTTCHNSKRWY